MLSARNRAPAAENLNPTKSDLKAKKSVTYSTPATPEKAPALPKAPGPAAGGTEGERRVHLNDENKNNEEASKVKQRKGEFVSGNSVRTSKYTIYTLLPLNLSEQFSKLANIYFLIISLLQLFTPLSPTSRYTTAGPLLLVLMVNLIREMWEDSRRHRDDAEVNNRMADVVGERGESTDRACSVFLAVSFASSLPHAACYCFSDSSSDMCSDFDAIEDIGYPHGARLGFPADQRLHCDGDDIGTGDCKRNGDTYR